MNYTSREISAAQNVLIRVDNGAYMKVSGPSYFMNTAHFGPYTAGPVEGNRCAVIEPTTFTIVGRNGIEFISEFSYGLLTQNGKYWMLKGTETAVDVTTGAAVGRMSMNMMTHTGGPLEGSETSTGSANLKSIPGALLRTAMFFWPDGDGRVTMWGTGSGGYRFELGVDSAAKPGSGQWSVTSDERVKENIVSADLDTCYENVKRIPLKHFKWKDEIYDDTQIYDRRKLGWIAQDVEKVFKKAVRTNPNHPTVPNCKSLDADQIYACMYGTIQKLQQMCEKMQARIDVLEGKVL
jgi:hypothetical protein